MKCCWNNYNTRKPHRPQRPMPCTYSLNLTTHLRHMCPNGLLSTGID